MGRQEVKVDSPEQKAPPKETRIGSGGGLYSELNCTDSSINIDEKLVQNCARFLLTNARSVMPKTHY